METQGPPFGQCCRGSLRGYAVWREDRSGVPAYWSPDGQWVVAMCYEPELNCAPEGVFPQDQLQPKWHQYPYETGGSFPFRSQGSFM